MSGNIDESYIASNNSNNENSRNDSEDDKKASFYQQYYSPEKTNKGLKLREKCNDCSYSSNKADQACYSTPKNIKNEKDVDFSGYLSDSDSSESLNYYLTEMKYLVKQKQLPPIGVFWDIENCRIPKGRSAVAVAQLIRDLFFNGYREAEFVVVCDVKKENNQCLQELSDAQVFLTTIYHQHETL